VGVHCFSGVGVARACLDVARLSCRTVTFERRTGPRAARIADRQLRRTVRRTTPMPPPHQRVYLVPSPCHLADLRKDDLEALCVAIDTNTETAFGGQEPARGLDAGELSSPPNGGRDFSVERRSIRAPYVKVRPLSRAGTCSGLGPHRSAPRTSVPSRTPRRRRNDCPEGAIHASASTCRTRSSRPRWSRRKHDERRRPRSAPGSRGSAT
jgi:hypothetical protein